MICLVLLLSLLSFSIAATEIPESVPEAAAEPRSDNELYVVHFTTGPAWIEGKPFMEQSHAREHSANLQRLRSDGTIVMGARYDDVGMIILKTDSQEAAHRMISEDPAIVSGVFEYSLAPLNVFYPGCVEIE